MNCEKYLRQLEGLHTVETAMETLGMGRQATLNLLSKIKKEGYLTTSGGGKQKRVYKITMTKQRLRDPGMFDILNRYNPHFKLNPWYDHQVHGTYTVEDAIIDAIETRSFRAILATLRLFNHVTDWPRLYKNAKKYGSWQKVGALYDVARMFLRARKIPTRYTTETPKEWQQLTQLRKKNFPEISAKWQVYLPFNKYDIREIQ